MIKALVGLVIATGCMVWALRGQQFTDIGEIIQAANWWLLVLVGFIFMGQQALRAHRQMNLVRSSHPTHSYITSFHILCVTFFFINTLPIRMGEVLRPILLFEKENMPFGSATAVVFVERILDLMSAILMLVVVLALARIPVVDHPWLEQGQQAALILLFFLVVTFLLPFYAPTLLKKGLDSLPLPVRIQAFSTSFLNHLQRLRENKVLMLVLCETVIIWLISGWMYVLAAWAFGLSDIIGYVEGIGILAFTMFGMAAPSAPGFAGTYEAAFVTGLDIFGSEDATRNIAFALCFHWWIYLVQSSSALFFLARDKTSVWELWTKIRNAGGVATQK